MNQNLCLSGGADGADAQWGMMAGRRGHSVVHWSFADHRYYAPASEIVVLSEEQLKAADVAVKRANTTLQRKFPTSSSNTNNLLRRNWYQVRDAQSVYAVSKLDKNGLVDGGTAWATQMYMDRFLEDGEPLGDCRLYLFDMQQDKWLQWSNCWFPLAEPPPEPTGIWAGIGSRKLLENGKWAIRNLLGGYP